MKYKISKEFFPFSHFNAPIINGKLLCHVGAWMRPPRSFFKDSDVCVKRDRIRSFDGKENEVFILESHGLTAPAPCLVYYHGGGFIFGGSFHHYNIARQYTKRTPCKLIFAQYRLAPKHPHPTPSEDCYAALRWVQENADALGIDASKIAVGGDSAGGALTAAVCQMARDRGTALPLFQLLIYPVTDCRMETESNRIFTDTPMWNSKLSKRMWRAYLPDRTVKDIAYASPMLAKHFENLPTAYVETAELDCLHDEALAYAAALQNAGVAVEINETEGTIHGFDAAMKAAVSKAAIQKRIEFMQKQFDGDSL